ncbi:MAG TPA: hypothetical protein VGA37_13125 [Gemmatimonadales bacterium]
MEPKRPSKRTTYAPFSRDEIGVLRTSLRAMETVPPCPRCGSALVTGAPVAGGGSMEFVWRFACDSCERKVMMQDL